MIQRLKKSPVTLLFFTLSSLIFLVARLSDPEHIRFLALNNEELPERWYTILTHGIVHVEPYHFLLNMAVLLLVGPWVEQLLGKNRYFILIVLCILAGGLSIVLWREAGIGFSGAGFGLLFYYYLAFPRDKELFFQLPNVVLPIILFGVSVIAIVFGLFGSVGHIPHLAGGMAGAICLFLFRSKHGDCLHKKENK
ncbi:rhomboid family intramembrane serine protease [Bacillus sp. FJAT-44742]|uniref:rhomboid family intramembrane serine protease n=1 Tax=Bacillus sp. FJAT-44742 TaxID=2014005 RepID=UPI001E4D5A3E|nr:rhomboid family intramembrane serine protease [Bacillus sp. FJAT-44742]